MHTYLHVAFGACHLDLNRKMNSLPQSLQRPSSSFTLETLLDSLSNNSLEVTAKFSRNTLDAFDKKLKENGVVTKLRDFQIKGVLWMLEREKDDNCIKMDMNDLDTHTKYDDKMNVVLSAILKSQICCA